MAEFELIQRLRERLPEGSDSRVLLGIGDDGAVVQVPADQQLVVVQDSLVEGVHFFPDTSAQAVGHKALAVNLSDLVAMGARPAWVTMGLTLPQPDLDWLDGFLDGFLALAEQANIQLIGGDTCAGGLSVSMTALGLLEPGKMLTRKGASAGDLVVVSGTTLGCAGAAVDRLKQGRQPSSGLRAVLDFPQPRLALGRQLSAIATACIDVSDGLLADLGHLLLDDGLGADIALQDLPCSTQLENLTEQQRWAYQLSGGDDYELCFCCPASQRPELSELSRSSDTPLTVIGRVTDSGVITCYQADGKQWSPGSNGYAHFNERV